ncbi:MAG: hypothetical protein ACKVT0_23700 [Planctomycetaceae bacterium]
MKRSSIIAGMVVLVSWMISSMCALPEAKAAGRGQPTDWNRFYYYPYVYYPHNYQRPQGSFDHLYYRYPAERRIPVFNKDWHNFYLMEKPYYRGHHDILDVF